jgi:hypothetical protein
MKRNISICQLIECRSTSGSKIKLLIREPLNSFLLQFCCTTETDKGSLKSCRRRASGKENDRLISNAMMKLRNVMLVKFGGGKVEWQKKGVYTTQCRRTQDEI